MNTTVTKIIARTLLIVGVFALAVTAASFRAEEPGITLACNGVDLKIDSQATYNGVLVPSATWALKDLLPGVDKFFNFNDIKPGDQGENTISIHVKNSNAWVCLDFKNVQSADNGQNEPESLSDTNGDALGELASGMEFFSWYDDGDNIFELGEKPMFGTTTQSVVQNLVEKTYPICDASNGVTCYAGKTKYIGVYWCAGDLSVNLATASLSCNGTVLGNEAQTDSMSVDVSLTAYVKAERPGFKCEGGNIEGCSPGYWKQSRHYKYWASPYTPTTKFSSVFENAFPNKTLVQVLGLSGGGLNALGRQTVAALLNAANPDVDYTYTEAEVIAMFNAVYPSGDYTTLKDTLEYNNTIYCPLAN